VDEQEHDLDTARTAADVQLQQAFVTEPQPLQQNRVAFNCAAIGMSSCFVMVNLLLVYPGEHWLRCISARAIRLPCSGSAGLDDSSSCDDDLDESRRPDRTSYGEDQALGNGGVPWRSAISQKVRSKMEQKTTKEADKAGNKGVQVCEMYSLNSGTHVQY
jgi:hypothetical protein